MSAAPTSPTVAPSVVTLSQWLPLSQQFATTGALVSVAWTSSAGISSLRLSSVQQSSASALVQLSTAAIVRWQPTVQTAFRFLTTLLLFNSNPPGSGSCIWGYVGSFIAALLTKPSVMLLIIAFYSVHIVYLINDTNQRIIFVTETWSDGWNALWLRLCFIVVTEVAK